MPPSLVLSPDAGPETCSLVHGIVDGAVPPLVDRRRDVVGAAELGVGHHLAGELVFIVLCSGCLFNKTYCAGARST